MGTNTMWGSPAKFSTDASGNTVLVGADGVAKDRFPLPLNPNGLDWLTDTIAGFDIYERGFVKRPTLFFDPSATSSLNRGTFKHPYNTQAALEAVIKGDMAGHVLGFKRGTEFRITGANGLLMSCYGSAAAPFYIAPYGDAEALPILTSGVVVSTWALCTGSTTIYKFSIAAESDIWQNDVRVRKVHPTNGTTNNDTGTTVTNEATAVTALTAKGAGWSVWVGGVLYFYPVDGENPNLGQCEVTYSTNALSLSPSNVATTGFITVAGIDVRKARSTVCNMSTLGLVNPTTEVGSLVVVGSRFSGAGYDNNGVGASDGLLIYGVSDTVRLADLYVAGNYVTDCLNNGIEVGGVSSGVLEGNQVYSVGGNCVVEPYWSTSGLTVRYNYGNLATTYNRAYQSFNSSGWWLANKNAAQATDTTHLLNVGNTFCFNLVQATKYVGFQVDGGSGHNVYHNTFFFDDDSANPGSTTPCRGWATSGTAPNSGFMNMFNNLFYWKKGAQAARYGNMGRIETTLGASACVPTGNQNVYMNDWAAGSMGFYYSGANQTNFTTYKTALSGYTLDQGSSCTTKNTGGTLTLATLGFNESTATPLAAGAVGATGINTIGNRYQDGQPYLTGAPTIGCLQGT